MNNSKSSIEQNHNSFFNDISIIKLTIFIIFSALFFGIITYKIILNPNELIHEYDDHILAAAQMYNEGKILTPHFLFHLLTIIQHYLLSFFNPPTDPIISQKPNLQECRHP